MGRKKKIATGELIKYIDEFCLENPGVKLSVPKIGEYIRNKGRDVQDYLIRRDKYVKEWIDNINKKDEEANYHTVVTFHGLDVENFINQNTSKEKMRNALTQRDEYYSSISKSAAEIFNENKRLRERNNQLEICNNELKEKLKKKAEKALNADLKEKDKVIKKLNSIINDYVYPEVANALLQKEGLLEVVTRIITEDSLEKHMLTPESNISKFKHESVNMLLKDFDE